MLRSRDASDDPSTFFNLRVGEGMDLHGKKQEDEDGRATLSSMHLPWMEEPR